MNFDLSTLNWSIIIAVLASLGLVGVLLLALQKQNFKLAGELLGSANNNPALKDAIEQAGRNVSPEVVNLLIGLISAGAPLVSSDPDLIRAIEELKKLIVAVTDGLPNSVAQAAQFMTTAPTQPSTNTINVSGALQPPIVTAGKG